MHQRSAPGRAPWRATGRAGRAPCSDRPQKVLLADLQAVMAQDGVGRGHVEKETGQRPVREKIQPGKAQGAVRGLDLDRALLGAFDFLRLESVQERDGAGGALLELGETDSALAAFGP